MRIERNAVSTLELCARCGARGLHAVPVRAAAQYYCPSCTACWRVESGLVVRVNPQVCEGCPEFLCRSWSARLSGESIERAKEAAR